ncbi:MAG TPA: GWxTD domain-containing protein, partial [Thermoanaerobaculia bacterium]
MTAAVLFCLAATAFADLSREYREWALGPVQFLLTKEEAATWKTLGSDADAKEFVDLFWARRDPTPGTPRNEYRETVEARIKAADETFTGETRAGSLTDRGKTLVLYGAPKRSERAVPNSGAGGTSSTDLEASRHEAEGAVIQWTYEGDEAQAVFGAPRAVIRFVDRLGTQEYKVERGRVDLNKAQERAVTRSLAQASLTAAPTPAAAAPAAVPASAPVAVSEAPAAPAVTTDLTTEAFRTAVAEAKYSGGSAAWGEFVTSYGEYFVPVGVYIPKSTGVSGTDATFFGVVQDASGKNVLAFEEPVTLTATKDDFFVDKSLSLPAGKHKGIFGVAQNGKVVALTSTDMTLAGTLDKDASAASQLILSNNVYPLSAAQKPNDPFAFGGLKVIPKADRTFRPSDELWYFVELRHPGLVEP